MNRSANSKFSTRVYLGNVALRALSGGDKIWCNAVSLSRGGMTLFCGRFVQAGESVELELPTGSADGSTSDFRLQGQIAQVRVEMEGNLMDVTFTRILTLDEMKMLESKLGIKVCQ